jgi:hypothetical protein
MCARTQNGVSGTSEEIYSVDIVAETAQSAARHLLVGAPTLAAP